MWAVPQPHLCLQVHSTWLHDTPPANNIHVLLSVHSVLAREGARRRPGGCSELSRWSTLGKACLHSTTHLVQICHAIFSCIKRHKTCVTLHNWFACRAGGHRRAHSPHGWHGHISKVALQGPVHIRTALMIMCMRRRGTMRVCSSRLRVFESRQRTCAGLWAAEEPACIPDPACRQCVPA